MHTRNGGKLLVFVLFMREQSCGIDCLPACHARYLRVEGKTQILHVQQQIEDAIFFLSVARRRRRRMIFE